MCAREQPNGDARSKHEGRSRGAIAVLLVGTTCDSALAPSGPQIQPRRGDGEDAFLLAMSWRACRALRSQVCRLSVSRRSSYVQCVSESLTGLSQVTCTRYTCRAFCPLRCLNTNASGHARHTGRLEVLGGAECDIGAMPCETRCEQCAAHKHCVVVTHCFTTHSPRPGRADGS